MNLSRQDNCCLLLEGALLTREDGYLTMIKAHTCISILMMGMLGPEKISAESETIWVEKWGGF